MKAILMDKKVKEMRCICFIVNVCASMQKYPVRNQANPSLDSLKFGDRPKILGPVWLMF